VEVQRRDPVAARVLQSHARRFFPTPMGNQQARHLRENSPTPSIVTS
jgi:hypothetical protein